MWHLFPGTLRAGQPRCSCALVLPERIVNNPHLSAAGCSRMGRLRRPGWWFENLWKKGTKPNCRKAKHEMKDPYRMSARIYVHHLYSGTDPQEEIGRGGRIDAGATLNHKHRTTEMTPDQAVHPIAPPPKWKGSRTGAKCISPTCRSRRELTASSLRATGHHRPGGRQLGGRRGGRRGIFETTFGGLGIH